ncbi:hypothetical protein AAFP35_05010 [Gordonia sp. CPCC 206044]|uniref:hypothetical protein n=1 Tax=Gordonia sp. CPCC 206044 TaxID=3140793 RepID=UPI003AF383A5
MVRDSGDRGSDEPVGADEELPPGWSRMYATGDIAPVRSDRGSRPALLFIGAMLVVIIVLAGLIVLLARSVDRDRSDEPAVATPSTTVGATTPTSTPAPAVSGIDGGPGLVAGPNFADTDNPYRIAAQRLPFAFAFPDGWDCMYGSHAVPTSGGYTCFESRGGDSRVGGVVGYQRCAAACTADDLSALGEHMHVDAGSWRPVDPSTTFSDVHGTNDAGEPKERIGMRFVYAQGGRGEATTIAFVVMTGDPEMRDTMLKIVNSVRANAR